MYQVENLTSDGAAQVKGARHTRTSSCLALKQHFASRLTLPAVSNRDTLSSVMARQSRRVIIGWPVLVDGVPTQRNCGATWSNTSTCTVARPTALADDPNMMRRKKQSFAVIDDVDIQHSQERHADISMQQQRLRCLATAQLIYFQARNMSVYMPTRVR